MSDRPERGFEVDVKPGFLVTMACLVIVYGYFHAFNALRSGAPAPLVESLNWGAAVTVLILLGTLFHELGHVVVGLAAGHQWTRAVLNGAGLGVVIEPKPEGWQRIWRSIAGPVVHFLFALPLLAVAYLGSPAGYLSVAEAQGSVWWVGGISSLFLAVLNALPLPGFDGAKVVVGIRELLDGRRAVAGGQTVKT